MLAFDTKNGTAAQAFDTRNSIACYLLLLAAYIGGLFVPLMNNDSAHHANIALHIHQSGEWTRLITQGQNYLDKPHLLFWLAAASFKLFGVNAFAYKLPSLLFSILAVHATIRLGALLHSAPAGRLAGVILASSFSFMLANNDVRMDALLTGSIMLATWQLAAFVTVEYGGINDNSNNGGAWKHLVLGGFGLALGFAAKGMIGVAMPLIAIFLHLLYRRDWARLFDSRWLTLALITVLFMSPVLYAYYDQFGSRGVAFILWGQNVERLAGVRFGNAGEGDSLFFVHTYLWAFLPWSLLGAWALAAEGLTLLKNRLRPFAGGEALTLGTIVVMFVIISASRFKLPHYLNTLLPFFAIQLAARLAPRLGQPSAHHVLWWVQAVVIGLLAAGAVALNAWAFPLGMDGWAGAVAALATLAVGVALIRWQHGGARLVLASVTATAVFFVLANFNAHPQLLAYQGGTVLGKQLGARGIDTEDLYYLENGARASSFDFAAGRLIPSLSLDELGRMARPVVLYVSAQDREKIAAAGLSIEELTQSPDYRVTRLDRRFLDPRRRAERLKTVYLIEVMPQ
ncbi:MAG: glycosyltransferase family 39 protein [Azoarcus sp.]|nr:glycosyltransferase family 39 protein [Azoarcus sp.]